jgi:hypothetical protein
MGINEVKIIVLRENSNTISKKEKKLVISIVIKEWVV